MTATTIIDALRRYWILVSTCLVIGLIAGATYAAVSPARYVSTAQLLVKVEPVGSTTPELVQAHNYARQLLPTLIEVASQDVVTSRIEQGLVPAGSTLSAMNPANTTLVNLSATTESAESARALASAGAEALSDAVEQDIIGVADGTVTLTIVNNATKPSGPVSPKWDWSIASGGAVGLIAGLLVAVLVRWIKNRTVVSTQD